MAEPLELKLEKPCPHKSRKHGTHETYVGDFFYGVCTRRYCRACGAETRICIRCGNPRDGQDFYRSKGSTSRVCRICYLSRKRVRSGRE